MGVSTYLLREWAMVFVTFPLLILPGLGPAYTIARRKGWGLAWAILLSIGFTFAIDAALETIAYYLGLTLTFVTWCHALAALGSVAWLIWRRSELRHGSSGPASLSGFLLAACAAVTALVQQPWWFGTPDTYYHLAAARSVDVLDAPLVTDPFFGIGSTVIDATSGSLHPVMAVISRLSVTDVATGYTALTAFGAALLVLAFWTLVHEAFSRPRVADLVTLAYAVFAWHTDFRVLAYPKHLSLGLAFIAIALVFKLAREKDAAAFVSLAAVGFGTLAMHLGAAELVLLVAVAVSVGLFVFGALFKRGGEERAWRQGAVRIMMAAVVIAVLAMPVVIPRVTSLDGTSVLGSDSFKDVYGDIVDLPLGIRIAKPGGFGYTEGPTFWMAMLITLFVAFRAIRHRRTADIVALSILLLVPALTVFPPTSTPALNISSYMVMRMLHLLRFAPFLALGWAAAAYADHRRSWSAMLVVATLAAMIVSSSAFIKSTYVQGNGHWERGKQLYSVGTSHALDMRTAFGRDFLFALREEVGDRYPRVMASQISGYHLMGLADISVVAAMPTHAPVFMPMSEADARRDAVDRFFSQGTDEATRLRLVDEYDVDYVFVSDTIDTRALREELLSQDARFEPVLVYERAVLLQVKD